MTDESPYVLVFDRGTTSRLNLPSEGRLVLGSGDADVRWPEASVGSARIQVDLTRHGATLTPLSGVVRINGAGCVQSEALASGDEVVLGELTFTFHGTAIPGGARAALEAAQFKQRLAEEAERFLRYESPFALLVVDAGDGVDATAMATAVCRGVRRVDVVGWLSRTEMAVLLPETTTAADIPARRVLACLGAVGLTGRGGLVTCPLDACNADALLAGARLSLRSAEPGQVRTLAESAKTFEVGGLVAHTADPAMLRLFELIGRVAASDIPVLIQGETGAGKEVVAQALHAWSKRAHGHMVAMNCAAIPENLLESELFGYERGAFTGATQSKPGMLEKASGGTLFLDEVGDLSGQAQAKLLRVLETGRVMRVGATQERSVDVRVISATHRDLEAASNRQEFRLDLFYRLSAGTLLVPPLRDRTLDIALLARVFLERACQSQERPAPELSLAVFRRLSLHGWPGNIRELKNLMEYLAASVHRNELIASDLPERIAATAAPWMVPDRPKATSQEAGDPAVSQPGTFRNIYEEIEELERMRIRQALEHAGGTRTKAAQLIGMPLRTMLTKMKHYGLENVGIKPRS